MKSALHSRGAAALVAVLMITALLVALSAIGTVPLSPRPDSNSAVGTTVGAQEIALRDHGLPAVPTGTATRATTPPGTTTTTVIPRAQAQQ